MADPATRPIIIAFAGALLPCHCSSSSSSGPSLQVSLKAVPCCSSSCSRLLSSFSSPVSVPEASDAVVVGPPLAAGAEQVPVARYASEIRILHVARLHHVDDVRQQRHLQGR
jgi:hypothetical protein